MWRDLSRFQTDLGEISTKFQSDFHLNLDHREPCTSWKSSVTQRLSIGRSFRLFLLDSPLDSLHQSLSLSLSLD